VTLREELEKLHFCYAEGGSSHRLLRLFVSCIGTVTQCEYVAAGLYRYASPIPESLASSALDGISISEGADPLLKLLTQPGSDGENSVEPIRSRLKGLEESHLKALLPPDIIHHGIFQLEHGKQAFGILICGSRSEGSYASSNDWFVPAQRLSQELFMLLERNQFAVWCQSMKHPGKVIGLSEGLIRTEMLTKRFANANCPILISGATGTGKELIARLIHFHSPRRSHPFIAVNCGAFTSDQLLGSELFGHVKGAFTGADTKKVGKVEMANGGTLFLDEVACMSNAMQVALLRTLRYGEIQKVGDTSAVLKTDVRIIAACNENLAEMVAKGTFREDIFSRLRVAQIQVPSLEERRADIPALVHYFLDKIARETSLPKKKLTPAAMAKISASSYPDNVAGLENCLYHAFLASDDVIEEESLPPYLKQQAAGKEAKPRCICRSPSLPLSDALASYEADYIQHVLTDMSGNVSRAAKILGITRQGLQKKLRRMRTLDSKIDPVRGSK
jgi:DNA-binding NtrC family response regulator